MTTAIARVREMKSPIHGEFRGFRIETAIKNREGHAFGRSVPSFAKPYRIYIRGDFAEWPAQRDYEVTEAVLKKLGFNRIEWLEA